MSRNSVIFGSVDGSTVSISGYDVEEGFVSYMVARLDGGLQEFVVGGPSFGRSLAADLGVETFGEQYVLQGGRLLLGSGSQEDPVSGVATFVYAGVWEGVSFSVETVLYGENVDQSDLMSLYDLFHISETARGVALTPRDTGTRIADDSAVPLRMTVPV